MQPDPELAAIVVEIERRRIAEERAAPLAERVRRAEEALDAAFGVEDTGNNV